ncbi:DUF4259 domain-containing protein [Neisseria zalophi]|uniref:DUF4259 domain-containing protein n=1 Tax=Neisseria zalophi TaxID=640030 RepID=A0A5J6PS90_9NEIS|nr:DUF4259 domain-containing protein [Neisseria zalophi]QEY25226.1 DUF4259 domain-containing protein [Neisseria zalophi]
MGAWGTGNFENDEACDWLYEFGEQPTRGFLEKTLDAVYEDEYLESNIAVEVLAAIETIALIMGNSKENPPGLEDIDIDFETIKNSFDKALFDKAIKSINRILDKNDNELYELWEGDEDWENVVLDLRKRINELMNQN